MRNKPAFWITIAAALAVVILLSVTAALASSFMQTTLGWRESEQAFIEFYRPAGDPSEALPITSAPIPEGQLGYAALLCGTASGTYTAYEVNHSSGEDPSIDNRCICYANNNTPLGDFTATCSGLSNLFGFSFDQAWPINGSARDPGETFTYTPMGTCGGLEACNDDPSTHQATLKIYTYGEQPYTPTPSPTLFVCPPEMGDGILYDNGMEEYPNSSSWSPFSGDDFKRLTNNNLLHRLWYGTAYCGSGFHHIGGWSTNVFLEIDYSDPISQEFCWTGGPLYWGAVSKGGGTMDFYRPNAKVEFWKDGGLLEEFLRGVSDMWTSVGGEFANLDPGYYEIKLKMDDPDLDDGIEDDSGRPYTLWDNVQISHQPIMPAVCATNNVPPGTGTPTGQPTLTATCAPAQLGPGTCGFTNGSDDGWRSLDGVSGPYHHSVLGDVYFIAYNDGNPGASLPIGRFNKCGDGKLYINFEAWGGWRIRVMDTRTSQFVFDFMGGSYQEWVFGHYNYSMDVPEGEYEIIVSSVSNRGAFIDSFAVGGGANVSCNIGATTNTPGPTPTYTITATPRATNTGTLEPTQTATATRTNVATRTPYPSLTPWPTYTATAPEPTDTPRPTRSPTPSRTPRPSDTPRPTDTVPAGNPTSTLPPTYTPEPSDTPPNGGSTDTPTPTYVPPGPPQQPPPACYSPCLRPSPPRFSLFIGDGIWEKLVNLSQLSTWWYMIKYAAGNSIAYLGGWMDYVKCQSLSYIAWCPEHTEMMAAVPTEFAVKEPIGTINEVKDSFDVVATVYAQYNWAETGVGTTKTMTETVPSWDDWQVTGSSPYSGGQIDITGEHPYITGESSTTCDFELEPWVGEGLGQGMCFAWSTLDRLGVLGWFQFIVNLMAMVFFVGYIMRRWVNAGTGSG